MLSGPPYALREGTEIGGYEITRFIGEGGFGIVYEAQNPTTRERVAIKEYFPKQMVSREGNTVILHTDQQAEMHRRILDRFAETSALQFGFSHKNILKIKNYIRGNNTG